MLHWLCNVTYMYNRRKHKHSHTMQTIKWNKLTHIQCSCVHMSSKYMNKSVFIFFHTTNFRSLLIFTVGSTLARAEHCTWHVGSLTAASLCFAWHVTLTWTSDQCYQIHRGQQGVSRDRGRTKYTRSFFLRPPKISWLQNEWIWVQGM